MTEKREMLCHFLAALAYRTQKALRHAPAEFADFEAGEKVRSPRELIRHMTSVLGYARTFIIGGEYWPEPLPTMADEIERFHAMVEDLADRIRSGEAFAPDMTEEKFLQGPFSDAMTDAGQIAMLRRLFGSPVAPENFVFAHISPENLTADQPPPANTDRQWREAPEGWKPPE